ncbi:PAS domain-containing protein [Cypionkella sp.]|uniref:sensor histidine kinase n=1 Tax=Cypionkella sp. TaxID=2811411 RepID=UPI0026075239|nr:PAS domain-containing protein [Cypionkella sp.]MDB5665674.1 hypothetical protein [Cypionkella sp.]
MSSTRYGGPQQSMAEANAVPENPYGTEAASQTAAGVYPFGSTLAGLVVTDALKQRLGFSDPAEIPIDLFLRRVHPSDRAQVSAHLAGADQSSFDFTLRLNVADGTERPFVMRGVHIGAHNVSGVLVELSRNNDALHVEDMTGTQTLGFAAIADAMPQMVWSTRPDGFHDYYNAVWYDFTGVPPGSTDGEGWNGMFHPDDQARAWQRWEHSLATGAPYEIEYRLRHNSGEYRWVLGRARAVRDDSGQIVRWLGTCTDINDTKKAAAYVELLSQELSHRIKNIFAIIQSLIGLSGRRAPESAAFARDLQARIASLGRAHDLARPHSDQSRPHTGEVTLHSLAREILKPYLAMDDGRITISGEDVSVDDAAATPFALILHELATNAKKYGALSADAGKVDLFSRCDDTQCRLVWTETGGPDVTGKPVVAGFGTKLMLASAQSHLNGQIEWQWTSDGVVVNVSCPRSSLLRARQTVKTRDA